MPTCSGLVVISGVAEFCGKPATHKWFGGFYCRRCNPGRKDPRFPGEPVEEVKARGHTIPDQALPKV